jgi:hypothetical protein
VVADAVGRGDRVGDMAWCVGRRCTLTHELAHDDRKIAYDASTPPALVEKEEAIVRRISADRLVPLDELERFLSV